MMSNSCRNIISFMLQRAAPLTAAPSRIAATSLELGVWNSTDKHWMSSPVNSWPFKLLETTWSQTSRCCRIQFVSTKCTIMATASPRWGLPSNTTDKAVVDAISACSCLSSSSSMKGILCGQVRRVCQQAIIGLQQRSQVINFLQGNASFQKRLHSLNASCRDLIRYSRCQACSS